MPTQPRPEQIQALVAKVPKGPLVMLNLLKFKEKFEFIRLNGDKLILANAGHLFFLFA